MQKSHTTLSAVRNHLGGDAVLPSKEGRKMMAG